MNIIELSKTYMETTRPSVLKKQKISNIVDVMKKIRHYIDLQERNKKVRRNQLKKLAVAV